MEIDQKWGTKGIGRAFLLKCLELDTEIDATEATANSAVSLDLEQRHVNPH